MKFYIVTPTFNSLSWLQCCIRSVADQVGDGVEVHHHVQDGASTDGTIEWLAEWQQNHTDVRGYVFTYESAGDEGMYDAINKAWEKMPSDTDVTAHLNSDEQYLPRALKGVAEAFEMHSAAEIVLGTYIIVDADGGYICHRRPVKPSRWRSQTVCEIITCSCFHKVSVFQKHGIRFNIQYRALADLVFYRNIVAAEVRCAVIPQLLTSTFALTGKNLAWTPVSYAEWVEEMAALPWYMSWWHPLAYRWTNLLRLLTDFKCPAPRAFSMYVGESSERVTSVIDKPRARWGNRGR